MNINIWIVLIILFWHWIADFVLQSDEDARGKSKNWNNLLNHTGIYSISYYLPIMVGELILNYSAMLLLFPIITFICHTGQDYYTSRVNAQLLDDKKIHQFFISVGFDQLLHFIQLLLTYQLLK